MHLGIIMNNSVDGGETLGFLLNSSVLYLDIKV